METLPTVEADVPPEIIGRGGIAYVGEKSGLTELASQIVLEMTERGLPDTLALETISRAKGHAVRVALDDVTLQSAANLAILSRTTFDIVKLDRSLAAQITPQGPQPEWLGDLALLVEHCRNRWAGRDPTNPSTLRCSDVDATGFALGDRDRHDNQSVADVLPTQAKHLATPHPRHCQEPCSATQLTSRRRQQLAQQLRRRRRYLG